MASIGLLVLGISVGTIGALIGAGGGFILVPILLMIYPAFSAQDITSISLAVVFINALSALFGYMKLKRIDFRSGLFFSSTALPAALLGTWLVTYVSRSLFSGIFGILLIAISLYLALRKKTEDYSHAPFANVGESREMTDATGKLWRYHSSIPMGLAGGLFVGLFSGFSGVGGGFILVPILTQLMGFPMQIATATSVFMLVLMTFVSNVMRGVGGNLFANLPIILPLAVGAVIGAQLGVRLSKKTKPATIVWILAICLMAVGVKTFLAAF